MELETRNLTYEYEAGTSVAKKAVDDISVVVPSGQFLGIVGHTGSGKTTFVQLLDALLKPTSGSVYLDGEDIFAKGYDRRKMRSKIGIVFQHPEYQLFEATVLKDVCFGPKNLGLSDEEAEEKSRNALKRMGIKTENFHSSPFELSGGQKRRVAIAGALAVEPSVLILDEPTAGLDPGGREEILNLLSDLHKNGMTIILISHSMEDVAKYVERLLVLEKGKILLDGTCREVFTHVEELEQIGLAVPEVTYLMRELKNAGLPVSEDVILTDEAVANIKELFDVE